MADLTGRRILIVDDEPLMRSIIKKLLWGLGKPLIEEAGDGQAALDMVAVFKPDVVLCDLEMLPMKGMEFLEKLRSHFDSRLRAIPVIILTGHGEEQNVIGAARIGVAGYLVKPISQKKLGAQIDAVLASKNSATPLSEPNSAGQAAFPPRTDVESSSSRVMIQPFFAEAIHELRTPLNAICGFSEAMKLGLFGPVDQPKYVEYVAGIHAAGMHMQRIVDGLLRLARAESGEDMLDIQPIDVGALVGEAGEFLRIQAEASGVDLKLNIAAGLTLRSDPTKLMQIILNLGSNAVKYTPRGGRVTIEAKPGGAGGALIMVIRDTGVGIAPEDIATAMRPFGRVPGNGAISGVEGTGLGLPLAQRYVDQIGGTLTISSAPGRGTIVTVRLPPEPDATANNRAAS